MSVFTNPASSTKEEVDAYINALLGLVGDDDPMNVLSGTSQAASSAIAGLSRDEMATAEAPGKWSIAQVLQHLADSEVVLAWRLRMILAHDQPSIQGYDQDLWASRLKYDSVDPKEALADFTAFRRANLRLLAKSSAEERSRYGIHAERGKETVAHIMKLYSGHDRLHLAQIERVKQAVAG